jgi:hypothetical protein
MNNIIYKIDQLKKKLEELKAQKNREEGKLSSLFKDLEKYNVKSIEEANSILKQKKKQMELIDLEIEQSLDYMEGELEKYD